MEEVLRQPPQLILTPLHQAPTTDLTNTGSDHQKEPEIRVRDIREVKTRIHLAEVHEPYDPANPEFVRSDRPASNGTTVTNQGVKKVTHRPFKIRRKTRAPIRPATASLLELASRPKPRTAKAETSDGKKVEAANPGPLEPSSLQLTAKRRLKLKALFGATHPRGAKPPPKRVPTSTSTHGTENDKTTNPGPRERSPQLIAVPVSETAA